MCRGGGVGCGCTKRTARSTTFPATTPWMNISMRTSPPPTSPPTRTGLCSARQPERRARSAGIRCGSRMPTACFSGARAAGIKTKIGNHSFRATGITAYLKHPNSRLEVAQHLAGHESPRTTKLYDRREEEVSLDEVEKI